jgi:hypothetical protein
MNPESWLAANDLGAALQKLGRDQEAVEVFYEASKIHRSPAAGENLFASVERYVSRTVYRAVILIFVLTKVLEKTSGPLHDLLTGPGYLLFFTLFVALGVCVRSRRLKLLSPEVMRAYDRERILLNAHSARFVWPFGVLMVALGSWGFIRALLQSKLIAGMQIPEGIGFVILVMGFTFIGLCWWSVRLAERLAPE